MKIFDQEHYDLMIQFEREHSGRFDKEAKEFWPKGIVYQDGCINELFLSYRRGYAFCEADMRSDIQNLEASRDGYRSDAQRNSRDAARYRVLRRKVCIAGGKFHILNLAPTYVAPNAAVELDSVLDDIAAQQGEGGGA